jgi:hypothetical protein
MPAASGGVSHNWSRMEQVSRYGSAGAAFFVNGGVDRDVNQTG